VRALATELGMNRDTLADHLRRMRAHGRVYVQHDGHGTIGAVWAARRTT
jgi:DNA-binding transcriptional regulator YhcF (GntR family)